MEVDTSKLVKSPEVTFDYDKASESLKVTVELPGVKEGGVDLRIAACGFCVSADTESIHYNGCYRFFHEVDADAAKITFTPGAVSISVPFFAPICGKQIPIDMDEDDEM